MVPNYAKLPLLSIICSNCLPDIDKELNIISFLALETVSQRIMEERLAVAIM